jgi:hypothetical protein
MRVSIVRTPQRLQFGRTIAAENCFIRPSPISYVNHGTQPRRSVLRRSGTRFSDAAGRNGFQNFASVVWFDFGWKIPGMRRSAESALGNVSLLIAVTSLYILVALALAVVFL